MRRRQWTGAVTFVVLWVATSSTGVRAQTQSQWWPELDVAWRPEERVRLYGLARVMTAEEASNRQRMLGLHADLLWIPRGFLRIGYRSVASMPDTADHEHRALLEGTLSGAKGKLSAASRTRGEWRWIGSRYSWRLRERVLVQYDVTMPWKRPLSPYVAVEAFYDTRYRAVARERYQVGVSAPIGSVVTIDVSYLRQDETRASFPHVNVLWSKLSLAFGRGG